MEKEKENRRRKEGDGEEKQVIEGKERGGEKEVGVEVDGKGGG